jgi:hypothetical protein
MRIATTLCRSAADEANGCVFSITIDDSTIQGKIMKAAMLLLRAAFLAASFDGI